LYGLALTPNLLERARARLRQIHQATIPNLEMELRKLKQAFLSERLSVAAYEQQRTALLTRTVEGSAQADDPEALVPVLRKLPVLLTHATNAERRTVLQQLITEVYVRQKAVIAFRPTRLAERLFQAAAETPAWRDVLPNSGDGGPGGHTRAKRCAASLFAHTGPTICRTARASDTRGWATARFHSSKQALGHAIARRQ
jgi:hypothetical protein